MAQTVLHSDTRMRALSAFRNHFRERPDCFVSSGVNVYCRPLPDTKFVDPDLFVCFGVDSESLRLDFSYRIWDAGAPPCFVLEISSERSRVVDLRDKPDIYLEMGVGEYWRLDPTGGDFYTPALQGDRLVGGAWEPIEVAPDEDGFLRGHSPAVGLDLHAEPRRLRFSDPQTGLWVPNFGERLREREIYRRRCEAAEARTAAAEAVRRAAEDLDTAAEANRRAVEVARRAAEHLDTAIKAARRAAEDLDTAVEAVRRAAEDLDTAVEADRRAVEAARRAGEDLDTAIEAVHRAVEADRQAEKDLDTAIEAELAFHRDRPKARTGDTAQ